MPTTTESDWLTTKELADELNIAEQTIIAWRYRRKGPDFQRVGSRLVRYRRADIEAWLAESAP